MCYSTASIFVACKTEEYRTVTYQTILNALSAFRDLQVQNLRNFEIRLLNGINFHLNIYLPLRPAIGLCVDFKVRIQLLLSHSHLSYPCACVCVRATVQRYCDLSSSKNSPSIADLQARTIVLLYASLCATDLCLFHPPTILALSAIKVAIIQLNQDPQQHEAERAAVLTAFDNYVNQLVQMDPQTLQEVESVVEVIAAVQLTTSTVNNQPIASFSIDTPLIKSLNRKLSSYKSWVVNQLASHTHAPPYEPVNPPLAQQPTPDAANSHLNSD